MSKVSENGVVEAYLAHAQDKDEDRSTWPAWLRRAYKEEIKIYFVSVRCSVKRRKSQGEFHVIAPFITRAFNEHDAKQLVLFHCKHEVGAKQKGTARFVIMEVDEVDERDVPRLLKKNEKIKIITASEKDYHTILSSIKMEDKEDLLQSCQELKDILS